MVEPTEDPVGATLPDKVEVINVGLALFADAIADQGRGAAQVDWRIPAAGDAAVVAALRRLYGPLAARVDVANAEVVRRMDSGRPMLTGVAGGGGVVPGWADLPDRSLLHCGPALDYAEAVDPLRRSMRAAVVAEGWADDIDAADALLRTGAVGLAPANEHRTVVPMATAIGPSMPVYRVEIDGQPATHAPIGQGSGDVAWFGRDTTAAVDRLVFLRDVVGPVLAATLDAAGPVDIWSLAAQAVAMGDDVHVRTQAATNLLIRTLLPHLVDVGTPDAVRAAEFIGENHLWFLTIAMAGARALTAWADEVDGSSVVTGMSRNGTTFGVRLAGSTDWHLAPAPAVSRALYQPGRREADAAPDIGDSAVLELVGLGAACAAGSPAVAQLLGGDPAAALELTQNLDRICLGRSSRITLPTLGGRGSPFAIDARRAVELQATPQITTGILHRSDGSGQIGAGVAQAPIEPFRDAVLALAARLS